MAHGLGHEPFDWKGSVNLSPNDEANLKQVPQGRAAILGLQHLLTMYSADVIVSLMIGAYLHLSAGQMTLLISTDIFMCGIATLLQLKQTMLTGIGLPVVLGCAMEYVKPLEVIGKSAGLGVMYGSIIIAGIFIFLISGLFSKIRKLFPPVVTGSLITIIGFSLVPDAVNDWGGSNPKAPNFGDPKFLLIGLITMIVIILINIYARGFIKCISVLIGMIVGTIIASCVGLVSLKSVASAGWFHLPQPFFLSTPHFEWSSGLSMCLVAVTSMIESTGVFFALGDIIGRPIHSNDLGRGYRSEGLAAILGGLFNTFPYSTFSQNVGVIQLSHVKTRRPIYYAGLFLLLIGLIPKAAALFQIIPSCVLGGAMTVMFGMVGIQGVRVLQKVDFTHNSGDLLVVAISVGLGLGVSVCPTFLAKLPAEVNMILNNGMVVTSLSGVLMNLLVNIIPAKLNLKNN